MPETYVESYSQTGGREDLINVITNISPFDNTFMKRIGNSEAKFRTHEWQTETLQTATTAGSIEGASAVFASGDWAARSRVANYTHILRRTFSTSYSQEAINVAGISSEFDHQRELSTKELSRDINLTLLTSTSASGTSAAARSMLGATAAITTNVEDAGGNPLTPSLYNRLQQTIWTAGGHPDVTYANGFQKRQISGWTQPLNRNIDATGKALVVAVDVYDSDFGRMMIVLERDLGAGNLLLLEEKYWKKAWLRPLFFEELGKAGGQRRGYVESELTLEYLAETSSGRISGLATS